MLAEINARRRAGADCGGEHFAPAPPLSAVSELRRAARHHSLDMGQRAYYDHCSLEGCDPGSRIAASGWRPRAGLLGENIVADSATAKEAVQRLMGHGEHCANIMNPQFRAVGIGYAFVDDAPHRHYWTQDFTAESNTR